MSTRNPSASHDPNERTPDRDRREGRGDRRALRRSDHLAKTRWLEGDASARAILETVRTPFLVLDAEHRIVAANPAFREGFGLSAGKLQGRSLFDVSGGAWDVPELRSALEHVLPDEEEIRNLEVRIELEGPRTILFDGRRIRLEGEGAGMVLLSAEDITDRTVQEARLEAYARELERSNRDLESFAHAASHDLQEPLRKIRTYVDRIQSALSPEEQGDKVQRYLERMPEAVERMQSRIDDMLQLARIGSAEAERRPVALDGIVKSVLEDLEVQLAESDARVEVGELPTLEIDPSQMRLVFQNLIANAVKFVEEGEGPVIRIHARHRARDDPDDVQARDWWWIVVEDEGIGLEQEYAERIFTPFQRLHGRSEYGGSGVGLAICRRVVERHGGRISVEGRPGTGARFTVELPAPNDGGPGS